MRHIAKLILSVLFLSALFIFGPSGTIKANSQDATSFCSERINIADAELRIISPAEIINSTRPVIKLLLISFDNVPASDSHNFSFFPSDVSRLRSVMSVINIHKFNDLFPFHSFW